MRAFMSIQALQPTGHAMGGFACCSASFRVSRPLSLLLAASRKRRCVFIQSLWRFGF
jgi:hypothetical protein